MKRNAFFMFFTIICLTRSAYGQNSDKQSDKLIIISGKVLDTYKNPVEGAVLYIDNVRTNNTTKSNGSYKIKVSPSATELEVRSERFAPCIAAINGQTSIDFILKETDLQGSNQGSTSNAAGLQDDVKKSSGHRPKKMNTYNNIYQMIRGEVSGVIVNGNSIQVEQGHSFFGSSTPLFVVNGVIVQSIDNINPLEVKSINVLKGSAASIYGVNGTNGVICINLKNGSEKEE